jgi:phosphoribosylaminoimidazole-succinocarboxamide synthase
MQEPLFETNFSDLKLYKRGKVRDIYDLNDSYLIVATDRLSAFDVVLPDPIPEKGRVLTQISLFWFNQIENIISNHVITSDVHKFPIECQKYSSILKDRSILVKKAKPFPIECVVRGYISGSGWNSYKELGSICGIPLPKGLVESEKLPSTLFTPSTKEDEGFHDINISFDDTTNIVGKDIAEKLRDYSIRIYESCRNIADRIGIIIADTKFEFGLYNEEIILIDEIVTPDSSRFWPKDSYSPGGVQNSYDKQFVRDYLLTLDWNKKYPGPHLPTDIIKKTSIKYLDALKLFTNL